MNNPLVSVIIPCYNASKYVEQAVRSIMEQTYKNIEILVADDCSTDKTLEILERLSLDDSRIVVVRNEENLKIVKTLNKLVELATGKYIARMDADDISLPTRIQEQVSFLEKTPDYVMCGTNAFHIDEDDVEIGHSSLPLSYDENRFYLAYYSTFYHPTIMIRADIYKQNLYSDEFLYAEDYELWCRLIFQSRIKAVNLEKKLFKYRLFNFQSSNVHHQEQIESSSKIFDLYEIVKKEYCEFHKNIFFIHKRDSIKNKEFLYIKNQYKKLCKEKYLYSYECLYKLFYHVYKCYSKKKLFPFLLKPKGVVTLFKILRGR